MGKCLVLLQFDVLLTFIGDLFYPKQKRRRSELEIGTERVVGKYWKAKLWLGYKINKFILKKVCSHNSLEPWFLYFIAVPRTFVLSQLCNTDDTRWNCARPQVNTIQGKYFSQNFSSDIHAEALTRSNSKKLGDCDNFHISKCKIYLTKQRSRDLRRSNSLSAITELDN